MKTVVLATNVGREIRAVGGCIWLIMKTEFGLLIRAEIGKRQFRVLLKPITGGSSPVPPTESNAPVHVVEDLPTLRAWLQKFAAKTPLLNPYPERL